MNNLNSLIIDGKIEEIQKVETKTVCKISTERFYKNSSGYTIKESQTVIIPEHLEIKPKIQ